jgi:hypothetical protein
MLVSTNILPTLALKLINICASRDASTSTRTSNLNTTMDWHYINDNLDFVQEVLSRSDHGIVTWMYIRGPAGTVKAYDIGYIDNGYYEQYPDRLWDLYMSILAVLDGHYHCCLSGKVWNL